MATGQMRIQEILSSTPRSSIVRFPGPSTHQNAEETMAVVQRVVGGAGTDTATFCRWLTEKRMDLGGPLSGLCHWFAVNPQKTLQKTFHRPGIENLHLHRHLITNEIPSRTGDGEVKTDLMVSSHLHESTSISIIMILATVLFILLITAFVPCITRKKGRPQNVESQCQVVSDPRRTRIFHKDKPPDYDTAVRMKEREELELPSYSEAVSDMSGDTRVEDNNSKTSRPDHLPD